MNEVILCNKYGMIEKCSFPTFDAAIIFARLQMTVFNPIGIRIYFSDGTTAEWNLINKSDCLK